MRGPQRLIFAKDTGDAGLENWIIYFQKITMRGPQRLKFPNNKGYAGLGNSTKSWEGNTCVGFGGLSRLPV